MRIWRVVSHAPGSSDPPPHSPLAPSNPPPRIPMNVKQMSCINDRSKSLERMAAQFASQNLSFVSCEAKFHERRDCVLIVNGARHTKQDDVQSDIVDSVRISQATRAESGNRVCMLLLSNLQAGCAWD